MIAAGILLPVLGAVGSPATLPPTTIVPPSRPEDGCPSARQVTDALQARVPEALAAPAPPPARSDLLRAVLDPAPDGAVVHFSLVDARGEARLKRSLRASGRGRGAECVALADTIAAIVERFLQGIEYGVPPVEVPPAPPEGAGRGAVPPPPAAAAPPAPPAPPPAPPPPAAEPPPPAAPPEPPPAAGARAAAPPVDEAPLDPASLPPRAVLISVGGGWRLPAGGEPDVEGRLGAAFELGRGRHRLALAFAGGAATATEARWQSGTSTLRRFPFSAGLLLSFDTRPGRIEPALAATLDLLAISSSTATSASRVEGLFVRPAAGIELTLGYRLPVAGGLFVRPVATGGMTLTRYEVVTVGGDIVFRTPRVYAILGLEGGLVIR